MRAPSLDQPPPSPASPPLPDAGEHVPSLDQVLQRYRGRAHIHLELKSQQPALPAAVAALVRRHGWDALGGGGGGVGVCSGSGGGGSGWDAEPAGGSGGRDAKAAPSSGGAAAPGSGAGAALVAAPGLTITSFHADQLRRSKEVSSREWAAAGAQFKHVAPSRRPPPRPPASRHAAAAGRAP